MMKSKIIGSDIYPEIDNIRNLETVLGRLGVKISFEIFSGQVRFSIKDGLDFGEHTSADLCVIEAKSRSIVLQVYIGYGEISFLSGNDEELYSIKILEAYDN